MDEEYRKFLEDLKPLRENFPSEEEFEEAMSGWNHRVAPLLRAPRLPASPAPSPSQAEAK